MATFYIGTMNPKLALGNVGLMFPVLAKRKMPLLPRKAKGADEVGRIYKKTMEKAKAREKAELEALKKAKAAKEAGGSNAAAITAATSTVAGSGVNS